MRTVFLLVALLAASSQAAAADQVADSEMWLKMGVKLRRQGDHVGALEAFSRAHKAHASGKTMAQIGLAKQSLHEWSKASDWLQMALDTHEEWVESNRRPLEEAVSAVKAHIGWVVMTGPSGSMLWVDEISIGALPQKELRLDEGVHLAKVEKMGMQPWSANVTVKGGKTVEVVAMLEQARPLAKGDARLAAQPGLEVGAPPPGRKSQLGSMLGAGLIGGGMSIAVVGTVVWIQQERGAYGNFDSGVTGPLLLAGGLVGAIAGGVLIYMDRDVAVGLTAYGLMVSGTF
jgi:hypothetical protein